MTGIEMQNNIRREELLHAAEAHRQQKALVNEARAYAEAQKKARAETSNTQPVQNRRTTQTPAPKPILSPAGEM